MEFSAKKQRRLRNYILQPLLQIKLGLYSIVMAIAFSLVFTSVVFLSFQRLFELILDLTDLKEEVVDIISSYFSDIALWLGLITLFYIFLNILVSIIFTHRLIGPTVAFRRHINELLQGRYNSRITLRKADAFSEVAEELNELAASLERKSK